MRKHTRSERKHRCATATSPSLCAHGEGVERERDSLYALFWAVLSEE